jgi:hypothetical protein
MSANQEAKKVINNSHGGGNHEKSLYYSAWSIMCGEVESGNFVGDGHEVNSTLLAEYTCEELNMWNGDNIPEVLYELSAIADDWLGEQIDAGSIWWANGGKRYG